MTIKEYNEMKARHNGKQRKKQAHNESVMQRACIKWFRLQYPEYEKLLFCVPNGGRRNPAEAKIMKAEGIVSGVSDLILLAARKGFHSLCIEIKTDKGRQYDNQIAWQKHCEENGNKYIICRSMEEFMKEINDYLTT
jgi:hypothetical protein